MTTAAMEQVVRVEIPNGVSEVTISSIPQNYSRLRLVLEIDQVITSPDTGWRFFFNNTLNVYGRVSLFYDNGSVRSNASTSSTYIGLYYGDDSELLATADIFRYSETGKKASLVQTSSANHLGQYSAPYGLSVNEINISNPITSLTTSIDPNRGYAAGGSVSLWGII